MDFSHITSFAAGNHGKWKLTSSNVLAGTSLAGFNKLDIVTGTNPGPDSVWVLKGLNSNIRYTTKEEIDKLKAVQPGLGRPEAVFSAMIPIKKSDEWWNLAQDERRLIMEEQSNHIKAGMDFLPAVARKLYHAKDLGEPFDFITWFEFAPENEAKFNELLRFLRDSPEWKFVTGELDFRFVLDTV